MAHTPAHGGCSVAEVGVEHGAGVRESERVEETAQQHSRPAVTSYVFIFIHFQILEAERRSLILRPVACKVNKCVAECEKVGSLSYTAGRNHALRPCTSIDWKEDTRNRLFPPKIIGTAGRDNTRTLCNQWASLLSAGSVSVSMSKAHRHCMACVFGRVIASEPALRAPTTPRQEPEVGSECSRLRASRVLHVVYEPNEFVARRRAHTKIIRLPILVRGTHRPPLLRLEYHVTPPRKLYCQPIIVFRHVSAWASVSVRRTWCPMPSLLLRCSFSRHRFCGSLFIVLVSKHFAPVRCDSAAPPRLVCTQRVCARSLAHQPGRRRHR